MRSERAAPSSAAIRVALIGLPGAGKTRVGAELARLLHCDFVDTDLEVEQAGGRAVAELVAAEGWTRFRRRERAALHAALGRQRVVIATGGGAVETAGNRREMERSATSIVWLRAPLAVLLARIRADADARPLLVADPAQSLEALARRRDPLYAALADLEVETAASPSADVAAQIARSFDPRGSGG